LFYKKFNELLRTGNYRNNLVSQFETLPKKFCKLFSNYYPGGGNAAYRREVFDKTGCLNVDLGRKGNNLIGSEEKDLFDKMTQMGMSFYYLPNAILYHIIPEKN